MSAPAARPRHARLAGALAVGAPLVVLLVLLAGSGLDATWESHAAHFWLVLAAAAVSVGLGVAVGAAARERLDARLFLISLAFVTSAGFLGLHALATPGVLLGPNAGFELATPVGLVLSGVAAAASAIELDDRRSTGIMARSGLLVGVVVAVLAAWAALSLSGAVLDGQLAGEELDGWQISLAAAGVGLYAVAAAGWLRVYRRRRAALGLVVMLSFALLADAMVVIAWARNWHASWWEWHVLMLSAFASVWAAARREWHQERFSALYLERTLAGARDVSVLFGDLAGFTSFSERTPPAAVAAMLNRYFGRLVPLLEASGGTVHQLIGDAVMVVYNKAGDQPDHAARAAAAALALQSAAEEIARDEPGWPRFRVGVNSGEVLAGVLGAGSGHRLHGVVGDTVNLAARLEAQAPVGGVVIGAGTLRRLPPGALVEPLPPLRVKGKAEEVEAYVLRAMAPVPR